MARKYNISFVVGIMYVSYLVGAMVMIVGKVPDCSMEPNGWDLPLKALFFLALPLLLAILRGKQVMTNKCEVCRGGKDE